MKKKVFAIVLAAMMVVALVPALAFAAPSDVTYIEIGETTLDEGGDPLPASSGTGWSYAGGVLTLDGYNGGTIYFWPYEVGETLTIVLKNSNTITDGNLWAEDGNLVIQGSGSLTINATGGDPAIDVEDGTLTFDLGPGGKVEATVVSDNSLLPAIGVYDYEDGTPGAVMTATLDKIILKANNVVVDPQNGVVALQKIVDETSPADPSPEVPTDTYATIKATADGAIATTVIIQGTAAPAQPVKADPAGTVVKKAVTPKTGDNGMTGAVMFLMIAGAATAIGLAKRKYN